MGTFVKGDIVVIPYPFSDFSDVKRRPAFIVSSLNNSDVILCQITSVHRSDSYSILLRDNDFARGKLDKDSYIRPNVIFTANAKNIIYSAGKANPKKVDEVIEKIIEIIKK